MAVVKIVWADWSREIPSANMIAIVKPAAPAIQSVNVSSCALSGVFRVGVDFSIPEILPTSVSAPVAVTIMTPLPCVTGEFMNAMFDWSPTPGVRVGDHLRVLRRGHALTGQPGLVDLQRRGLDDATVGAHVVTRREQNHVADHDLVGIDLDLRSVPADASRCPEHRLKRVHRALCLALLAHPAERIQRRDRQHGDAGRDLADQDRGDRRRDQDDLHVALVLGQELLPAGHRRLGRKRVGTVLLQQLSGPGRGQALGGVDAESARHLLRRQRIPVASRR